MLFEIIEITSGDLNSGLKTEQLTDVVLSNSPGNQPTRPVSVRVENNSGVSVDVGIWTDYEYDEWIADNTISDLFPVANNDTETFNDPRGEIVYVTASGTAGHTGSITFTLVRE